MSRWREFGFGLALGLSLSLFVLVWQNYREKQTVHNVAEVPRPEPRTAKDAGTADVDDSARNYDFYDMLPNFEVVVPEKEVVVQRDAPEAARKEGAYVLQAGSYRKLEDADRVRAQLALQGIESNVQRVAIDADTWHRVRIGPISDPAELNRVRSRLKEAEVDFLIVRVGD